MRHGFNVIVIALAVIFVSSAGIARAQGGQGAIQGKFKPIYEKGATDQQFDPRDFTGIWEMTVRDHTFGTPPPALTPAGKAAMAGRIAGGGPVIGNQPWYACNPMGFPRLLNDDEPMEWIITKDKILQVFQWESRIRYLWTDGRALPSGQNLENLGPAWYGHSVANWDGDTLIVNTVGLDERAWLDQNGLPKSFHARIEERYRRTDFNTIEWQLTMYDPEYYTATWVGAKRTFRRITEEHATYFGWKGLFAGVTEGICAPVNEVEGYNKGFRDIGHPDGK
jgi:hypothetical protein